MKLSILLDGRSIRLCQGAYRSGKLKITGFSTQPLREGAVAGGILREPEAALDNLKEALAKSGCKAKDAYVTLSSTAISFREITVPRARRGDMLHLVRNELQAAIGINSEAVVDYMELGAPDKKSLRVLALAVQRPLVKSYYDLVKAAGLRPKGMDICSGALGKVLSLYPEAVKTGDVIALHVGADVLATTLLRDTRIVFTRLTRLSPAMTAFGPDPARRMEEICDSVSKMVQFHSSVTHETRINRVLVAGSLEDVPELPRQISRLVSLPCEPFTRTDLISCGPEMDVAVYAGALGALIGGR
jgi:Tfp pilus assembly PilM family ATPase